MDGASGTRRTRRQRRPCHLGLLAGVIFLTLGSLGMTAPASAATPEKTDVMFVFDTSASMGNEIGEAKEKVLEVIEHVRATLPDVAFGVANVEDIPGYIEGEFQETLTEQEYEQNSEKPWRLDQSVTSDGADVQSAIEGLTIGYGGDGPEAYSRALWETDTNPSVGWRPGARHEIVLVADNVPHDPNLNEGLPESEWVSNPFDTNEEPAGRWGIPETAWTPGVDLRIQSVASELSRDGKPLESVEFYGGEYNYLPYWEYWAGLSGGQAIEGQSGELESKLISAIETGATKPLAECPAGQERNAEDVCVTVAAPPPPPPPAATSDNGLGAPTPTCANHSVTLPGGITIEASCFKVSGEALTATGHIRVNGLDLVISGHGGFTIDTKRLKLDASAEVDAYAGSLHIYHGDLSWDFTKKLSLGVPKNLKIKGLPVAGEIAVSLISGGVNAEVNATVGNAPFKVSGEIDLKLTLASGLQLSSFRLELASNLPIKSLVVHKAALSYHHTSEGDVWKGEVEVELPAKGPTVAGELVVTNGAISEVGLKVSGINKPLGEVVFLQSLGLEVTFSPELTATGSIGLSAGPAIAGHTASELDGSLTAEIGEPFVLQAKGTLSLVSEKMADATIKATIPGGVTFKGDLSASFLVVSLDGTIGGEVASSHFQAEGAITLHAPVLTASGDALLDNAGLAGCASAKIGATVFGHFVGTTVTIGGSHRWSGENSLFTDSCGFGRLQEALAATVAAGTPATAVRVPPQTRQINLIVKGSSGPPEVELSESGQTALVKPNTTGAFGQTAYLAIGDPTDGETDIAIGEPQAGTIEVSAPAGQPALVSVSSVLPLPSPHLQARLQSLGRRRYRLSWRARAIPGQTLAFEEADARGTRLLGETSHARGHLNFTAPEDGARGPHRLIILVKQEGLPRETVHGPAFRPKPTPLPAPAVHVRLVSATALISWSGIRGAAGYQVSVTTSDGRNLFFSPAARSRSLRIAGADRVTVRVRAINGDFAPGRFGSATAKKAPRRASRRSRRG